MPKVRINRFLSFCIPLVILSSLDLGIADAQEYLLYCSEGIGSQRENVEVQILLNNNGGDIQGWGFGVCHDDTDLSLSNVIDGETTLVVNNGALPEFYQVNIEPAVGFTVMAVICFLGCAVLPAGTVESELNIADYELVGLPGVVSNISFCVGNAANGEPVEPIVVVAGASISPDQQSGAIEIQDCLILPDPPTDFICEVESSELCACQAVLSWQSSSSPISGYEVYVDGFLSQTLPQTVTSTVLPLIGFSSAYICIRAICPTSGGSSSVVCCSVDCSIFDCNSNDVLDECDILVGLSNDCNMNQIPDECDLVSGDLNANGIPDDCEDSLFIRADVNGDSAIDIGDAVAVLAYLFTDGSIECEKSSDSNDDGAVDVADSIQILGYLFSGSGDPPAPFPNCGNDPSEDSLSCDSYPGC